MIVDKKAANVLVKKILDLCPLPHETSRNLVKEYIPHWIVTKPEEYIPRREKREETYMVRWYYRSVFDDLEEMKQYMESLFHEIYDTNPTALLPAAYGTGTKLLPSRRTDFHVAVTEQTDEVIVTVDHIYGVSKSDITLSLINPQALEISCVRREEKNGESGVYYLHERSFGSITRFVALPQAVTESGSNASLRNGVLEIHLRKSRQEAKGIIPIE